MFRWVLQCVFVYTGWNVLFSRELGAAVWFYSSSNARWHGVFVAVFAAAITIDSTFAETFIYRSLALQCAQMLMLATPKADVSVYAMNYWDASVAMYTAVWLQQVRLKSLKGVLRFHVHIALLLNLL